MALRMCAETCSTVKTIQYMKIVIYLGVAVLVYLHNNEMFQSKCLQQQTSQNAVTLNMQAAREF